MSESTVTSRPVRRDPLAHAFAIGQNVRLRGSLGTFLKTADIYQITATLPPRENSPQYRIRNEEERHERVVMQDNIELAVIMPASDEATLIERTFSDGKGTKAKQPRNQETEAGEGSAEA